MCHNFNVCITRLAWPFSVSTEKHSTSCMRKRHLCFHLMRSCQLYILLHTVDISFVYTPTVFWNDFFICNGNMKMLYSIICSGMALRQWYIGSRFYCYWTSSLFHEWKHVANKGPRLDDFHSVFPWIFFSFPFFASEKQNYLIYLIFLFLIKQFIIPFNNY